MVSVPETTSYQADTKRVSIFGEGSSSRRSTRNCHEHERSNTMKRILIALALALGATAAVAEPTLDLQSAQRESVWKNAPEQTSIKRAPSWWTTTLPATPSIRNATHGSAGADHGPGAPRCITMEFRLVLHILGVVMLVAASLTAMADQSGRLVGVHEILPFVTERVEIVPKADHPVLDAPAQAGGAATVDSNPVRS